MLADARILVLDEPTRSLAPHEIDGLFASFAELRRDGYAAVFIAHKLREVLASADRITVMRRGKIAGALSRAEASEAGLVSLMFGGALAEPVARLRAGVAAATPVLALEAWGHAPRGTGRRWSTSS